MAVRIIVDVTGRVTAARAITGHPMLRPFCESAAREAKFSPTPEVSPAVKVKALFIYKFKPGGKIDTDIERDDKTVIGTPIDLVEPLPPSCDCRFGGDQKVMVEAKTDEQGNVIAAAAFAGFSALRKTCEKAALESKFLPTDKKAKIILVYNFEATDESAGDVRFRNAEIKEVRIEK